MKTTFCISLFALILTIVGCKPSAEKIPGGNSPDAYLGNPGLKLKATGYFRLEKKNGKHFFVTPTGNPFLALSVTHIFWGNTEDIPGKDIVQNLTSWNFNSAGYDIEEDMKPLIPYFYDIWVIGPTKPFTNRTYTPNKMECRFWDIFDPSVVSRNDSIIKEYCAAHKDNANLIGYYLIDVPVWYIAESRKLAEMDYSAYIKKLPATAPGKIRYIKFIRKKYSNKIESVNKAYSSSFGSFDEMLAYSFPDFSAEGSAEFNDDTEFLGILAEQYYSTVCRTIRKYDANHLILGDKYRMLPHAAESVLRAAVKYVDVISIEPRFTDSYDSITSNFFDNLNRLTKKPIMICDFDTPCNDLKTADDSTYFHERAARSAAYTAKAFETGYIIGYGKCQYFDCFSYPRPRGIVNSDNSPRPAYIDVISPKNQENLQKAYEAILLEYK